MLEMGWNLIRRKRHREAQAGMQATIIETLSSMVLVWVEQMPIQTTLRGCLLENVDSTRLPECVRVLKQFNFVHESQDAGHASTVKSPLVEQLPSDKAKRESRTKRSVHKARQEYGHDSNFSLKSHVELP